MRCPMNKCWGSRLVRDTDEWSVWSPRKAQSLCWGPWPLSRRTRACTLPLRGPGRGPHPPCSGRGFKFTFLLLSPPPGLLTGPAPRPAGHKHAPHCELTRCLFAPPGLCATHQPTRDESGRGDRAGSRPLAPRGHPGAHGAPGPLRAGLRRPAASAAPAAAQWPAGDWPCRLDWRAAPESGSFLPR